MKKKTDPWFESYRDINAKYLTLKQDHQGLLNTLQAQTDTIKQLETELAALDAGYKAAQQEYQMLRSKETADAASKQRTWKAFQEMEKELTSVREEKRNLVNKNYALTKILSANYDYIKLTV